MKHYKKLIILILLLFSSTLFSQSIIENFTNGNYAIFDIAINEDNVLIVGMENGLNSYPIDLFKYQNGKFEKIFMQNEDNIDLYSNGVNFNLNYDKTGNIFLANGNSIYKKEDEIWVEKLKIEDENKVEIKSFLIDNNNESWVISVESKEVFLGSSVNIVKNNDLIKIDSSPLPKFQSDIFKTYDDMLISYCRIYADDIPKGSDDIYFYKNGSVLKTMKLPSLSDTNEYKFMNQIYTDDNENIWFCYDGYNYTNPKIADVPAGVSILKKNGDWLHLTTQEKYPKANDQYKPAVGVLPFDNGWIVLLDDELIYVNEDFVIEDYNFTEFLDKTVFHKTTNMSNDLLIQMLNRLKTKEDGPKLTLYSINSDSEGRIYIVSNGGMFVYNNGITKVETDENIKNVVIYPNPVKLTDKFINIRSLTEQIISAKIITMTGSNLDIQNWQTESDITSIELPNGLSSGTYYLSLTTPKDELSIKFNIVK